MPTRRPPDRKRAAPARPTATANGDQPLYLQVAQRLKAEIAKGSYPIGSRLPTELALCEGLGISRFTARAAIRQLTNAGLVTRRQRVGTVVTALPDDTRYSHDVTKVRDLLQYAQDTRLDLFYVGHVALSKPLARAFGATVGDEWVYAVGMRRTASADPQRDEAKPICITRLYLNPLLRGIEKRLRTRDSAVYALIEREFGLEIHRVEQELTGVVLDADDAANLRSDVGAPALRIVRRYYGRDGILLQVADNIHPSDRFTYRMQLTK